MKIQSEIQGHSKLEKSVKAKTSFALHNYPVLNSYNIMIRKLQSNTIDQVKTMLKISRHVVPSHSFCLGNYARDNYIRDWKFTGATFPNDIVLKGVL